MNEITFVDIDIIVLYVGVFMKYVEGMTFR